MRCANHEFYGPPEYDLLSFIQIKSMKKNNVKFTPHKQHKYLISRQILNYTPYAKKYKLAKIQKNSQAFAPTGDNLIGNKKI